MTRLPNDNIAHLLNVKKAGKVSQLAIEAMLVAVSQVGQQEVPRNSNRGPMVDQYLAAVGLKPGYAWCQAFVNWCYEQGAKRLGVPEPVVNTAGVLDCWNRTKPELKKNRAWVVNNAGLLLPGDQFMMKIGTKGAGHTGLVLDVVPNNKGSVMVTIEGNTNDEGSREGYEVAIRERRVNMPELLGIIRY